MPVRKRDESKLVNSWREKLTKRKNLLEERKGLVQEIEKAKSKEDRKSRIKKFLNRRRAMKEEMAGRANRGPATQATK